MPLKKLCSYTGCNRILEDGVIYCDYHQAKWERKEKERYKEYSKRRREDKEQKKYQDFYNSDCWKRVRDTVIADLFGIDIVEYYRTGKIITGECVHHIDTIEDSWENRLDFENLIYLTEKNHRRIHVEYDKGQREKRLMQNILYGLLERWYEEFD